MSTKINLYISDKYTNVTLADNTTDLDIFLGVAALFDKLTPDTKKLLIPKLQKLSDLEQEAMLENKK